MPVQQPCDGSKSCVCQVCTCGHHNCPPGRGNAGQPHPEHKFAGGSEYDERYKEHSGVMHQIVKPPRPDPGPMRSLEGRTETKEQYKQHDLPVPYPKHENKYTPNPAHLDGSTNYSDTYQAWPTPERPHKTISPYKPNPDPLSGVSTSKADYKSWDVAPHVPHAAAPYRPNPDKFAGESVTSSTYKAWDVQKRHQHEPERAKFVKDDRDWATNSGTSYKPHDPQDVYHHPKQVWHPSADKFQGESVATADYTPKSITRDAPIKPASNLHTTAAKFDGSSVYHDAYLSKDMPDRYRHQARQYEPNPAKFEGASSSKSDFRGTQAPRTQSYAPNLAYNPAAETRDFGTENHGMFTPKEKEHCRVFDLAGVHTEQAKDGHVYYDTTEPAKPVAT